MHGYREVYHALCTGHCVAEQTCSLARPTGAGPNHAATPELPLRALTKLQVQYFGLWIHVVQLQRYELFRGDNVRHFGWIVA